MAADQDSPNNFDSGAGEDLNFLELVQTLRAQWPIIAIVAAVVLSLGYVYSWQAPRIFKVEALLQVETDQKTAGAALGELSELFSGSAPVAAEMQIIESRMVIGQVVDQLNLVVSASPQLFPLVGRPISRGFNASSEQPLNSPFVGLHSYAWGGEKLLVSSLDVPPQMVGAVFKLVAGSEGTYSLTTDADTLIGLGKVGELTTLEFGEDQISLFVRDLVARPGTRFNLVRRDRNIVISEVLSMLSVVERGKQSGIIALTFEAEDPRQASEILNAVAQTYQRQNVERKSAEAQQTLGFLRKQLPEIKKELETASAALNDYRLRAGSADLTKETELVLQQMVALEQSRMELSQSRELALSKFTTEHPSVKVIDQQLGTIAQKTSQIQGRVRALPSTQQEVLKLTRDVEVNTELYTALLNNAQQLEVVKAGTVGSVRIIDLSYPTSIPAKPNTRVTIALSLILGIFLGVLAVFARRALHDGVTDPSEIERELGLSVYGTIPFSEDQRLMMRSFRRSKKDLDILAIRKPSGVVTEAIRSLRTALHFGRFEASNKVIMLTGPSPDLGKSFVSLNLGAVLAQSGRRVVVIDADLRKGHLHDYLAMPRGRGLSELLSGSASVEQVMLSTPIEKLKVITTGELPPNPAELLLGGRLKELLDVLEADFDDVIIDTPPILAVTDAAIMGQLAGISMLILKSGEHPLRMIDDAVKRLRAANVNLKGVIMNQVGAPGTSRYGYRYGYKYGYYQYEYGKQKG